MTVSVAYGLLLWLSDSFLNDILLIDFSIAKIVHGILYIFLIFIYFRNGPVRDYSGAVKHGLIVSISVTVIWVFTLFTSRVNGPELDWENWTYIIFGRQAIAILFPLLVIYLLKPASQKQNQQISEENLFQ